MPSETWVEDHRITPEKATAARAVLEELLHGADLPKAIHRHPLPGGGMVAKHVLVSVYRKLVTSGEWEEDQNLLERIRMKPVRSLSGVTTVTVLTEPKPCPGTCIFCPDDARMPKSYLPDEPGAARAFQNAFDPYLQVSSRLEAYHEIGHPTEKIELLILGGTWDAYPHDYQEWYVRRCFDALNGHDSPTLEAAQKLNEEASRRNVGLVIETRPDEITPQAITWLRRLGVTKVQMGAQTLDDHLLTLNKRGHSASDTLRACDLLRAFGFKIVLHWMPNLLGATPENDRQDFTHLWEGYCPDEIKIYPTQLLENSQLFAYWQRGEYTPYTTQQLINLIADIKPGIPPYCRVNRIIRDIPSRHVVAGNKRTSLRQDVLEELARRGQRCGCIRCREIRGGKVSAENLRLADHIYYTTHAEERFLSYITPDDKIAGYLRLSLPLEDLTGLNDLSGLTAMIREVHVYGQSLGFGSEQGGSAQHIGLGTALLQHAEMISREKGFRNLAVIAAVGTRLYYEERGFERGELYMVRRI